MNIRVKNEPELQNAALELLKFAADEKVFLFEGEMGAGKTTLIKFLCFELGVKETVSSPTYSIVNEYAFPGGKIFHFDFFRIQSQIEALDIGFEEYLSSGDYCFIEWPQNIPDLWPLHHVRVKIAENEVGIRNIEIKKHETDYF
ncbi:MAG: tRNA (adenosine(37)-N6)-threonylcarbamoyltransferase complex ATPase subunit type 1 TsaE [Bacteroidetes bacterium]|nr:tRNA (adenosine(37)-N6)-threonylcarbamoyltransferase complex ATPase subunit type 1 TsaE [Bacteroidota bacterium]